MTVGARSLWHVGCTELPTEVAMTRDPESLPDSSDRSGPCPRCGRIAAYRWDQSAFYIKLDASERVIAMQCMGCEDSVVAVERRVSVSANGVPPVYEGIHWWPLPGSSDLDPDIPPQISSAYSEGTRALSVKAARSAVVMFRAMLAQLVADKGSPAAQAKSTL